MSQLRLDSDNNKRRLEALSDGIFAITMTMMIIDLKIPENSFHNLSPGELNAALLSLIPSVKSYILSFFILGIFWMRQQIQLNNFSSVNMSSIIVYILFLLLIGFVPFTVNLIKRYPDYHIPFILYTLNLLLISIIMFFNSYSYSRYKYKKDKLMDPEKAKQFVLFSGISILIFLAGFIVSFFDVEIAFYIVILDPVFFFIYRKFIRVIT